MLFTWTQTEGLKVYINGTYSTGDPTGSVSHNYGDPYADLVIGTGNTGSYGHYATGAFDEFVIWERALSPQDIWMYYKAAIGKLIMELIVTHICRHHHFIYLLVYFFCGSLGLSQPCASLQLSAIAIVVRVSKISCTRSLVSLACPNLLSAFHAFQYILIILG